MAAPFIQEARLSASVDLSYYRGSEFEVEGHLLQRSYLSLVKQAPRLSEKRSTLGHWIQNKQPEGSIVFTPIGEMQHSRWKGETEVINLAIDIPRCLGGKHASAHDWLSSDRAVALHDAVLNKMLVEMHQGLNTGIECDAAQTEWLMLSVVYRFAALSKTLSDKSSKSLGRQRIQLAIDYMHAHIENKLTITDVMQNTNYFGDVYAFIRHFKQHTGRTPYQYILDLRMERAKDLLMNSFLSITEVALQCGFSSPSHLSDSFRERLGMTASEVRRQVS